ncbi:MAG: type II secretion system protein GspL [Magnetococcus sp. WYHC-3]
MATEPCNFIFLPNDAQGQLTWVDQTGRRHRDLPQAVARHLAGRAVVLVVPGVDVHLALAALPPAGRRRVVRALPFHFEDLVAGDLSQCRLVLGSAQENGQWPVAVVSVALVESALAFVAELGLRVRSALPETLLVPWRPGEWSVLGLEGLALVRTGPESGFAVDQENLSALLELALAERPAPTCIRVYDFSAAPALPPPQAAGGSSRIPVVMEGHLGEDPLVFLASGYRSGWGMDLLEGAGRSVGPGSGLRRWLTPALALITLVAGVWLGVDLWQKAQLTAAVSQRRDAMEQLFHQALPGKRLVNARVQLEREITSRGGGATADPLLVLLADAGPVLVRSDGVVIKQVRYKDDEVTLSLEARTLDQLDQVKVALGQVPGLKAEVTSASRQADGVSGQLRVRR